MRALRYPIFLEDGEQFYIGGSNLFFIIARPVLDSVLNYRQRSFEFNDKVRNWQVLMKHIKKFLIKGVFVIVHVAKKQLGFGIGKMVLINRGVLDYACSRQKIFYFFKLMGFFPKIKKLGRKRPTFGVFIKKRQKNVFFD